MTLMKQSLNRNTESGFRKETEGTRNISGKERHAREQREAALKKYEPAVRLYATTDMPVRLITKVCHVSESGLRAHLYRWHRPLMLARYGVSPEGKNPEEVRLGTKKGPRDSTRKKYGKAVEACGSMDFISLSVSAIAREFGLGESCLGNHLRAHHPEIIEWREQVKEYMGIADNCRRGAKRESVEQYAPAVDMYRTSDMTVPEVAEACGVSPSGLTQHLRFYHRGLLEKKEARREQAKTRKKQGTLSGNGRMRGPLPESVEKYREAVALYRDTDLSAEEIVRRTGVTLTGFRNHLREWHRELMLERRGGSCDGDEDWIDLNRQKRYSRAVSNKYAAAIASMKADPRPTARVAAEYGFHPEVFRDYLHQHEPELAASLGMVRNADGKLVSGRAAEKYAEAVRLYETTAEDLKSIASRLGLTYNSLGGYVRRNCPEAMQRHKELVKKAKEKNGH